MVATAITAAVAVENGTGLLAPMSPEEMEAQLKTLAIDLRQIYVKADVPDLIQAQLAKVSYRSVAKLRTFASSSDKVSDICKSLGLGEGSLAHMGIISSVILAWENCKTKSEAMDKHNAERKILGIDSTLMPGEYTTIRQQFEIAHGRQEPCELPGASIIEKLDREIEDGEFTPWRLEELVSKEEVDAEVKKKNNDLGIPVTVALSGTMIRQQVRVKVGLPSDAEGFRRRINILNAGIELAKLKNPNHQLLGDSDEKVWNGHVKYILGKTVYGMETKIVQGVVVKTPSWELVLH